MTAEPTASLRAAQTEITRARLLRAAIETLDLEGAEPLTVRSVAARAGVSVPTAYRYFPTRESLLDAAAEFINRTYRVEEAADLDHAVGYAATLYPVFAAHERFLRAQQANPAGRRLRAASGEQRIAMVRAGVARSLPDAPEEARDRIGALVHLLLSIPAWTHLHDRWGLDVDAVVRTTGWALEVLTEAIRTDPEGVLRGPEAGSPAPKEDA